MNPTKAWAKFLRNLAMAGPGVAFEVGLAWDKRKGWRPYQSINGATLFMAPETGRAIVRKMREHGARPENASAYADMRDTFDELAAICDEADRKNAAGELPLGYLENMSSEGRA